MIAASYEVLARPRSDGEPTTYFVVLTGSVPAGATPSDAVYVGTDPDEALATCQRFSVECHPDNLPRVSGTS